MCAPRLWGVARHCAAVAEVSPLALARGLAGRQMGAEMGSVVLEHPSVRNMPAMFER